MEEDFRGVAVPGTGALARQMPWFVAPIRRDNTGSTKHEVGSEKGKEKDPRGRGVGMGAW